MKKIRYMIEAILLAVLFFVSKCLPAHWASNFGGWVGRTIGPRLAASRKAMNNIKSVMPDLSNEETQKIVTGMWDNLGRVMMEYPHLEHIGRDRTEIFNHEALENYKGKPVIFISAHLGNWECCPPALLLQLNYKNSPIYRAPNNPFADWLLKRARTLKGQLNAIPKSTSGTRNIVETLKNNQGIGMVIDQKYNEGIIADFMGKPAMTSPIFAQLAQKFDCPIVPLQIERLDNRARFRITVHDPIQTKNRTTEEIVDDSHKILEGWIKKHPSQWLWLHRRWESHQLKGNKNDQS